MDSVVCLWCLCVCVCVCELMIDTYIPVFLSHVSEFSARVWMISWPERPLSFNCAMSTMVSLYVCACVCMCMRVCT
jgi:hypothetical protein